ncbi:MAG TPA: lysophospholipid acyltransferase family protein [Gammaproteobacteria bacterium]|nr:lysophospholipid acyltransferase family protein [Gammaproteobacteria bacterium]
MAEPERPQDAAGPLRRNAERVYGVWSVCAFAALSLLLCGPSIFVPGETRRRRGVRRAARLFFDVTGLTPRVSGLSNIPDGPCIVVANHASYLDGILMIGVLPPRFGFIIKREMTRIPLAHLLLRRIGSVFVERFDPRGSSRDALRLFRTAADGRSLAFFPEGTFVSGPGVQPFRLGAFQTATRLGIPVVPVAIRGTRHVLPAGRWLPRPARLTVHITAPIRPQGGDREAALTLRDAARDRIAEHTGEPALPAAVPDPHPERAAATR